jgi:fatty-acyl-CoA synthase
MKISFSTLGCPEWSWEDIVATAKDFDYDGIEVRGIEKEIYVPKAKPFLPGELDSTKKHLNELGLAIPCITSSCYLHIGEKHVHYIQEAKEYIDLAAKLNAPYIRVLGDANPQPSENVNVKSVIAALKEIGEYAVPKNVTVLIETNGIFANSTRLKELMLAVNHEGVGVLWDIHHPYRFMNEPVKQTYNTLKEYIKHIHIKDSIVSEGKIKYKMMGQGDIPIKECLTLLKQDDYQGFISLEWVKRWYTDLEEPGIVFMQFENYIRDMWNGI